MASLFYFMHFVYILYSRTLKKYYVGYTANISQRVYKHNHMHKGFTNAASDWQLIYSEAFDDKPAALKRERQIKNWKSIKMIEQLIHSKG